MVLDGDDPSIKLRELFREMGNEMPDIKPILELNGGHEMVKRLAEGDDKVAEYVAQVLFGQSLLVEGIPLKDPVEFAARMNRLIAG